MYLDIEMEPSLPFVPNGWIAGNGTIYRLQSKFRHTRVAHMESWGNLAQMRTGCRLSIPRTYIHAVVYLIPNCAPSFFIIFLFFSPLFRAKFVPDFQPTDEANAPLHLLPVPPDGKYLPPSPEEAERIISNLLPRYVAKAEEHMKHLVFSSC